MKAVLGQMSAVSQYGLKVSLQSRTVSGETGRESYASSRALAESWGSFRDTCALALKGAGRLLYTEVTPRSTSAKEEPGDILSYLLSDVRFLGKTFAGTAITAYGIRRGDPMLLALGLYVSVDMAAIAYFRVIRTLEGERIGLYEQPATTAVELGHFLADVLKRKRR